jgi:hypothetical protein
MGLGLGWALFVPVFVFGAVRWGLRWHGERDTAWPALQPATDPDALLHGLMTGAGVLVLLLALGWGGVWGVRRWAKGHPQRQRLWRKAALLLWGIVWLMGAAQAWHSHTNRTEVGAGRHLTLSVVGMQPVAASVRSVGGVRVYLDWPEQGGLHTVLLESPHEDLLRRPVALTLTLAPGRWQGWFVQAWQPLFSAPAQPLSSSEEGTPLLAVTPDAPRTSSP